MIDSLFGSKTRVKLLNLFLNNPGKSFYVREITRLVDEQINSVRRELANMVDVGVIQSDNLDNKLYYSANVNYEYIEPLSAIFADDKKSSKKKPTSKGSPWTRVAEKITGIKLAIAAGKLASGSGSPVDLLLVGDITEKTVNSLIRKIEKTESKEINYTVMSFDNFYYRLSVRDQFIMDIVNSKHSVLVDTEGILRKE